MIIWHQRAVERTINARGILDVKALSSLGARHLSVGSARFHRSRSARRLWVPMTDHAPIYELPPADAELAGLIGLQIHAEADDGALPYGGIVDATVVSIDAEVVTLNANGTLVQVALDDARDVHGNIPDASAKVRVLIEGQSANGAWTGSIDKVRQLTRYESLVAQSKISTPIAATVLVARRSGFSLDVNGFRAFLPNEESGITRDQAFAVLGQTVDVEITGLDEKNLELRVSRKRFADQERAAAFQQVAAKLNIMDVVDGIVTSTTNYGAFVDINGIEGLLHISEMGIERVDARHLPVQVGDTVRVQIVSIDEERQRVGLSRKEVLLAEQHEKLSQLEPQSLVEGTVAGLTDFGAFIEFGDGFRGLCHVSELSWTERIQKPGDKLALGEVHTFRLLQVDPAGGRISLSLRQASDNPWSRFIESTPVGAQLDGRIVAVEDRGLVVAVNDELQGFVRLADLSWTIRAEKPSDVREFTVGETLPVALLQVDSQRQRILLGLKQLESDPWDLAGEATTVGHIYTATVERITDSAAFLTVVPGLEARMHISEISAERVESIRSALRIGEEIEVMTIQADRQRRRLDVSIKAIEAKNLADQPRAYAEESSMGALADALRSSGLVQKDDDAT